MVVELDLSPDCEAALLAAAEQAGRTVDETVNLAVMDFVERQDLEASVGKGPLVASGDIAATYDSDEEFLAHIAQSPISGQLPQSERKWGGKPDG